MENNTAITPATKKVSIIWIVVIQFILGYEWLHSGWGKWVDHGFIDNIAKILNGFMANNPNTIYVLFLQHIAIPNSILFGNLVRISELGVGIALILGGILLTAKGTLKPIMVWILALALFGGALMNLNFYLAAGFTSPSTSGINLVMGLIEMTLSIFYITNRKKIAE